MKHEFLNYLEENFYVEFDGDDEYVLDENGNISELYLWGHNHLHLYSDDPKYISDLSVLLPLSTTLKVLHVNNWVVEDMSPLKQFTRLRDLSLSHSNRIKKISGIEELTELESLDLSGNDIKKIEGLEKLTRLKTLDLRANGYIKTIEGLDNLLQLEALYLQDNDISTIENLNHLSHLKRLKLHHNNIKTWENTEALSNLTMLTIGNKLRRFPDLSKHPLLEVLGIMSLVNKIENLDPLVHLHTLHMIHETSHVNNPEEALQHDHLKNIIIDCEVLKGQDSPTFWNSDK